MALADEIVKHIIPIPSGFWDNTLSVREDCLLVRISVMTAVSVPICVVKTPLRVVGSWLDVLVATVQLRVECMISQQANLINSSH